MNNRILHLSDTEAARDFPALLKQVEEGAEAIIERHSEPVAILSSAGRPRRIADCIEIARKLPGVVPDPDFAADLEEIIQRNPAPESPDWE